jgi:DNA-binding NtrC family response regulator
MERLKAIVIDDEQIVLDSVKNILSEENIDVDISLSSTTGLNMALRNEYDIVLTDIRMPVMGGMRVLRDIKRSKPSMPVIMITGYASVKSAVQSMILGATNYIEKPFTPEELIAAVQNALNAPEEVKKMEQSLIHKDEMIKVLERGAKDSDFSERIYHAGADALDEYNLTGPEKLAILTADMGWIEKHVGKLTEAQKNWLISRLSAEIW